MLSTANGAPLRYQRVEPSERGRFWHCGVRPIFQDRDGLRWREADTAKAHDRESLVRPRPAHETVDAAQGHAGMQAARQAQRNTFLAHERPS